MRYLSLFSGIEAASAAWGPLGWECAAVSEVDPFCCALLAEKYPNVVNLGDITKITRRQIEALGNIDVVVFGSPCQDLSVAGKRAGLQGERSGLFFTAMDVVRWAGARFALWENVPGAFSSNSGRDFASVVGEMVGMEFDVPDGGWANSGVAIGPDGLVEWCVLDAQFFGVPQRRRRVFALRDSGDWRNRPPVLLVADSLSGDSAPRREAGQGSSADVAPSLTGSGRGVERGGDSRGQDPVVAMCLNAKGGGGRIDGESETFVTALRGHSDYGDGNPSLRAKGGDCAGGSEALVTHSCGRELAGTLKGRMRGETDDVLDTCVTHSPVPILEAGARTGKSTDDPRAGIGIGEPGDPMFTLQSGKQHAVAFSCKDHGADAGEISPTLRAMEFDGMAVRRLTPVECEKLQGFSPNYTLITHRDKPAADGPRYRALGNSFAVPVVRWIGERLALVDRLVKEEAHRATEK